MITTSAELAQMTAIELIELALTIDMDDAGFWSVVAHVALRILHRDRASAEELIARGRAVEEGRLAGPQRLAASLLLCNLAGRHYESHEETAP